MQPAPNTKSSTQHTPGPWVPCAHMAGTDPTCPCEYVGDVMAADVAVAFMGPTHRGQDEGCGCTMVPFVTDEATRQANARLIAAAPELLEIAEWFQGYFTDSDFRRAEDERADMATDGNVSMIAAWVDRAEGAIEKVRGEA